MDYIIKSTENNLTTFYYRDENIYYKTYENNDFHNEKLVIKNVLDNYNAYIAHDSSIYLFCQNKNGDIILCIKNQDELTTKVILQNQSDTIHKIQFTALITKKGLTLIYNTAKHLLMQQPDKNGKWKTAETIDTYTNLPQSAYISQNTSYQHLILFYLSPENELAYREINTNEYGEKNIFYSANQRITDTSFLVGKDALHMIFIVKDTYSYQLMYRKKDSSEFSTIKTLWESPKIENCLIFGIQNTIYVSFAIYEQLYIFKSEDNGNSFSQILKYKEKFATNIKKSQFIAESIDKNIRANEVYVSALDPCEILLFPELYKDFFCKKEAPVKKTVEKQELPKPSKATIELETFNRLQNQYNSISSQISEKDRQIEYYMNLVKEKNAEIQSLEENWQQKFQKLSDENEQLKAEFEKSKLTYEQLSLS